MATPFVGRVHLPSRLFDGETLAKHPQAVGKRQGMLQRGKVCSTEPTAGRNLVRSAPRSA